VLKNILYFIASGILFFIFMILYGIVLNMSEDSLSDTMVAKGIISINNPKIVIVKRNNSLSLYSDIQLVKSYKVAVGRNKSKFKTSVDDYITPEGTYKICLIDTNNTYYKFYKLNFPNKNDAAEALKNGDISNEEYFKIVENRKGNNCPPSETRLGSNIGIQGIGTYNIIFKNLPFIFNWTNGSIAISNESIDELTPYLRIGTVVEIRN